MSDLKLRWHDWQPVDDCLKRKFARMIPQPSDDSRRALAMEIWGVLCPVLGLKYEMHVRPIQQLADQMRGAIDELEDFAGPIWPTPARNLSLDELRETLADLKFYVWQGGTICYMRTTTLGRKQEKWHKPAYKIALLIRDALKSAGHRKGLGIFGESGISGITREIMSEGSGLNIEPEGFKKGLRSAARRRRTAPSHPPGESKTKTSFQKVK